MDTKVNTAESKSAAGLYQEAVKVERYTRRTSGSGLCTEVAYEPSDNRGHQTNPSRLVVIPARGGSKGIPQKNLQRIGKYTLLEHTIADAYELHCPIYVTTDDDTISLVAQEAGAIVIRRPPHLASDHSTSDRAILHTLEQIEAKPDDVIVFMQCTSPFRKPGEVEEALQAFIKLGVDSMFSCYELYPFVWNDSDRIQYKVLNNRPIRQEKKPLYVEDGSFYISRAENYYSSYNRFLIHGRAITARWIHDKIYGLEIDNEEDLECARTLYSWLKSSGRV